MSTKPNTKTVNGLMSLFFGGAAERKAVVTTASGARAVQFTLTARQFQWLRDVAQREDGFVPTSRTGRASVQGEIDGGQFEANEQKGGSALVLVRY
jgi:hypothetical protein